MKYQRFQVEKKAEFNRDAIAIREEIVSFLNFSNLEEVRVIAVYDLVGVDEAEAKKVYEAILWDPVLDEEVVVLDDRYLSFRYEAVEGQFDQRADSTSKLASLILGRDVEVLSSKIVAIRGLKVEEFNQVKAYHLNPVEYTEIPLDAFTYVGRKEDREPVRSLEGFITKDDEEVIEMAANMGLGLDRDDLFFCRDYFRSEDRDPTETELKMIETYWSDHCRHTTFLTEIQDIEIEGGKYQPLFQEALESYLASREFVKRGEKPITLMDLATINAREIKAKGLLEDQEKSDEVNAASIEIDVDVDGKNERWLLMFKNETHNHPTEIEPFGGASTCLGGAIRDPLSGRSYVYQAMRITGAGDPFTPWDKTLEGKLPQRKITKVAMEGYASYGYQIGANTGLVREYYHDGFVAKRMELGALVAAVKQEHVTRGKSEPGDVIILLGGDTGRDGLGAAVGSSKGHTEDSLSRGGTDVQKGNPLVERKIVRLFRNPEASKMIKVCNDFGAGGVSVAIGELADGLTIDLNKVPVKYPGLNGTELALSESQERMAVVLDPRDVDRFMDLADAEDCQAVVVAKVTENPRVIMTWNGQKVVDISRAFLATNGVVKETMVTVSDPKDHYFDKQIKARSEEEVISLMASQMKELRYASQRNLALSFDTTVGAGSVLLPYGGKMRMTPVDGMVAKIPVLGGETTTCSIMSFGYDPYMSGWSPYHAGYYAVLQSLARFLSLGGNPSKARLTFQEYFERLNDRKTWGKPFAALLGAFKVQKAFDTPSIGGKDSMSGSFEDISVPPTLVSFAVGTTKTCRVISPELKEPGHDLAWIHFPVDEYGEVDLALVKESYEKIYELLDGGDIYAMANVDEGGVAKKLVDMAMGNLIGVQLTGERAEEYFVPYLGDLVIEVKDIKLLANLPLIRLGETIEKETIVLGGASLDLKEVIHDTKAVLEPIFRGEVKVGEVPEILVSSSDKPDSLNLGRAPKVFIPVFFGTHGEYTLKRGFERAGAVVDTFIVKSSDASKYKKAVDDFANALKGYDILAIPDGSVYGEEPEFAGKFLSLFLRETPVLEAVSELLSRKGLVLGVGDGFAGLLHAGYFEDELGGQISDLSPVMAYHRLNRFTSTLSHVQVVDHSSPWFSLMEVGEYYTAPVATQLGRLILPGAEKHLEGHHVATVFVNRKGELKDCLGGNPTGSDYHVESLLAQDGKILGTTMLIDRVGKDLYKNREVLGKHKIFESAVSYFK